MEQIWLSVVALVVSLIAVAISFYFSRKGLETTVMPILVFTHDKDAGWYLHNVGNGPALNVTVADGDAKSWLKPVRCYPLPAGGKIDLFWLEYAGRLGVAYTDAHGRKYTGICQKDISKVIKGHILPKWRDKEIRRERELRFLRKKQEEKSVSTISGTSARTTITS